MRMSRIWLFAALFALGASRVAVGQGVQTGTLSGTVRSADGLSLPGATVTVSSSALQGQRTAVTDVNGVYFIKGLPAGVYTVAFELSNFKATEQRDVSLGVGGIVEVNQTMALAAVTESVTVSAQAATPVALAVPTLSQAYGKSDVDALPVGRVPSQIADLAPGLNSNTPNAGQVSIAGATAFDNVFMVNGVDVNDNLFGTANNLFIEDAIQETNVLIGGISAEYGRFSGGVINVITKSGGNTFSGSLRENFSNTAWISETPRQEAAGIQNPDVLGKSTEGTFGGPIMRDALWFFASGRYEKVPSNLSFILSDKSALQTNTNKRGEIKFTGTPASGHTISGDYTNNSLEQDNRFSLNSNSLDPSVLIDQTNPNTLFVTNYNGVLARKFFATLQYSQKKFGFRGGNTNTAITASPIMTRGTTPGISSGLLYGAPYFSGLDPEDRNNHQVTGSLSYTLSNKKAGTHDIKGGGEYYRSTRVGGNSQSATNYVFQSDYLQVGGKPVYDGQGVPVPVWTPGVTRVQNWLPTVGAVVNINTTSFYLQDKWVATPRLSVDLGLRFEAVRSDATGDITTVDTTTWVPRLGVTYDLQGNGKTVVQASYGHYAGKYSEAQFAGNTDVGNPSRITYGYTGPAGQGRDFGPAYDLKNYSTIISASFPTANIFVADGLHSPLVKEFTTSLGHEIGRGFARATYQYRTWSDIVENFIDLSNGIVNVNRNGANIGDLTKVIIGNTDGVSRTYQAIVLQAQSRFQNRFTAGAHYTLQLTNNGNSNIEAANQPGITSIYGDYPEIYGPALDRLLPDGRLADFQRNKVRVYGTYTQKMGSFGALDVSPIWRIDSGTTFSYSAAAVPLTPIELARNPGYPTNDINANTTQTVFFGDRGVGQFLGYGALDFAATYSVSVWKTLKPWVKVEFYNLLNNDKQIRWDTTVSADNSSPKDANGLPTGYINGANFGKATNDNQFLQPIPGTNGGRLFRMALGFRF
ncbi:MAG TPA: TonB-dependent receptor [Vicinamibacterales bacterium]|jgi:hypothetical protein